MPITRRRLFATAALLAVMPPLTARAGGPRPNAGNPAAALFSWYYLVLEMVRHTATYSPPVASRAFAYIGVTAWEALASGDAALKTLAGQLNGLTSLPGRGLAAHDETIVLNAALAASVKEFFWNTGPTGQRVYAAVAKTLAEQAEAGKPADVVKVSTAFGQAVAAHVLAWSKTDGCAPLDNMGFPLEYRLHPDPGHWVPTGAVRQQQFPLLPAWGGNRTFAISDGAACALPPPPAYSEEPGSELHRQATEVYETGRRLTNEQKIIARFWSDDPMLTPTPPGHWISIILQIMQRDGLAADTSAEALARTGIALADAFIACWRDKFVYDLVRPVTYIRKCIDPAWEPLLITPPFPEYPSGHSTQSGAVAAVLEATFGEAFTFTDGTHERDGIEPRRFAGFWDAAKEAGISRLYGGIHFRASIELGLDQGRCVGRDAVALVMR